MMDENLIVEKFREIKELGFVKSKRPYSTGTVSYTHLTLPTKLEV